MNTLAEVIVMASIVTIFIGLGILFLLVILDIIFNPFKKE